MFLPLFKEKFSPEIFICITYMYSNKICSEAKTPPHQSSSFPADPPPPHPPLMTPFLNGPLFKENNSNGIKRRFFFSIFFESKFKQKKTALYSVYWGRSWIFVKKLHFWSKNINYKYWAENIDCQYWRVCGRGEKEYKLYWGKKFCSCGYDLTLFFLKQHPPPPEFDHFFCQHWTNPYSFWLWVGKSQGGKPTKNVAIKKKCHF